MNVGFYVFDVDSMNRRLLQNQKKSQICEAPEVKSMHTHTSKPSAKNFIDFDFIVPYGPCFLVQFHCCDFAVGNGKTSCTHYTIYRNLQSLLSNENICKMPITWWVMMKTVFHIDLYVNTSYSLSSMVNGMWKGWNTMSWACVCVC